MEHSFALIGLAVLLFAATNIDDVFVLLAFFSDPGFKTRQIFIGHAAGIGALYGISVVASLISLVVPPAYIGLLGLAPIAIGLKMAWDLRKESSEESDSHSTAAGGHGNVAAVAAVTVANGGDNISVYTPWFATRSAYDLVVVGVVFAVMTVLWLAAAHWLTQHRTIGAPIRRYGNRVAPLVLVALGVLVMYEAGSFELLRHYVGTWK